MTMLSRLHRFLTGRSKGDSNPILIALFCGGGILLLGGLSWLGPKWVLLDDHSTLWLVTGCSIVIVFHLIFKAIGLLDRLDKERRETEKLQDALAYANAIIDTVREPLLILDGEMRVARANRAFCDTFQVAPSETENRPLDQLGEGEWNLPGLQAELKEALAKETSRASS